MHDFDSRLLPTERESHGICIRKYQPGDAAGLVEAAQESIQTVGAWLDWCTPSYGNAQAEAWIAHAVENWDKGDGFAFAVIDATCGDYLGGVGLNQIDHANRSANLGYWIRQSYQARGVGAQAARLAVGYVFEQLGLTRIEIACAAANRPSRRIAEKTGARYEGLVSGRIQLHGRPVDAAIYSITAPSARRSTG